MMFKLRKSQLLLLSMSALYDLHYTTNRRPVVNLDGPNFQFRGANLLDVPELVELDSDAYGPSIYPREYIAACLSYFVVLGEFYVLTFREDIIGTVCISVFIDFKGAWRGYVRNLAVFSRWRGMGVGRYLMNRMIEIAREQDCDYLALDTWPVPGLHTFYWKKMGMRYCEEFPIEDGPYKGINGTYYTMDL